MLAVCIVPAAPVTAQTKDRNANNTTAKSTRTKPGAAKPRSGWLVQCTDAGSGLRCSASQSLILAKTRQRVLTVTVQRDETGKMSVLYRAPLGLFLPAGIAVTLDDKKPTTLPFQTCNAQGCFAAAVLSDNQLAGMRKGKALNVVFQNLKKKPITLSIRLQGFDEAHDKIK